MFKGTSLTPPRYAADSLRRLDVLFKIMKKWRGYLTGLGLAVLATLLGYLVHNFFGPANIIMIYLLSVSVAAVLGGLGPSIMVSILSVLAFDFFFIPPYLTFEVEDTQYIFTFIVLLLVGITISYLTSRIRRQTELATLHEQETAALYTLGRDLAISGDLESYVKAIVRRIKETLKYDVVIYLPDAAKDSLTPYSGGSTPIRDEQNIREASIFLKEIQSAPKSAVKTLGKQGNLLPLVTARGPVGVMALMESGTAPELTPEQGRLLNAYADLAAVAIEGIRLADELQNARVYKATEKLQTALLNAISHDLRTPLVSVIGTLSSLQEDGMGLDDEAKQNLIQVAREQADRLNHLITNLLDESRIEAGAIKLSLQPAEPQELVHAALEQLGSRAAARRIIVDVPAELPYISVDFGLIVQTLENIIDNALKYSPAETDIKIKAIQVDREIQIEIADRGIGVPEHDLPHIFDKFYRIKRPDNVTGTGLGLSISKGIIEAHGGRIMAAQNPGGGTIITVTVPLDEPAAATEK